MRALQPVRVWWTKAGARERANAWASDYGRHAGSPKAEVKRSFLTAMTAGSVAQTMHLVEAAFLVRPAGHDQDGRTTGGHKLESTVVGHMHVA